MKLNKLMTVGLMVAGLAALAQGENYYGPRTANYERRDVSRDLRERNELLNRIDADRRAVEHERMEARASGWRSGHELRELRAAQARLDADLRQLDLMDRDLRHDGYRDRDRYRDFDRR